MPSGIKTQPGASDSLYKKHEKIYPKWVTGLYAKLRILSVFVLLGLYFGFPWIEWGGRQAVWFDLPSRKFYYFGITFWPQDFFYLAGLLITLALILFLFTALAGRLWCGYSCPQTVWTEVYLWIEHWLEGDRNKRIKFDKQPMNFHKFRVKSLKHLLWLLIAFLTGFTFVGYFIPIKELSVSLFALELSGWALFWVVFFTFATYANAGWMREQVCTYMCPYARFQSAMFDKDTLIISYDSERGDPKGSRRRGEDPKAKQLGDCVDCSLCVQVCPTGIDIRDGLQYQCIGCAACVDVCDSVMDKMGYAPGLVRYTTEHALEQASTKVVRPRIIVYAIVVTAIVSLMAYFLWVRIPLELDIIRDRSLLYHESVDGDIQNLYQLRIINMDQKSHRYRLSLAGLDGGKILGVNSEIVAEPGEVLDLPIRVQVAPGILDKRMNKIFFTLESLDHGHVYEREESRFIGPIR